MRLLWTTAEEKKALYCSALLAQRAIDNTVDSQQPHSQKDQSFDNQLFRLWILDEDRMDEAKSVLSSFLSNPEIEIDTLMETSMEASSEVPLVPEEFLHPLFNRSPSEIFLQAKLKSKIVTNGQEGLQLKPKTPVTSFFTFICCLFFLISIWSVPQEQTPPVASNPAYSLRELFLFDYTHRQELVDTIASQYGEKELLHPDSLPPEGKKLYEQAIKTPAWTGFWDILLYKATNQPEQLQGPLFEKISQGEVWRLVTPILLHADLIHLFFNMIWLIILAPQIELRIGGTRFLLLTLILAVFSNTVQYLVSGPAFIGFSGVICGYAAFIWVRMKYKPWEGYIIQPGSFAFLFFFIALLTLISLASFFIEIWFKMQLPIGIANSAHISGAIVGAFLAGLDYFRSRREDGAKR